MSRVSIWGIIEEMTTPKKSNNPISKAVEPTTTADEIEETLETSTAEDVTINNTNNEEDKGE
jgi:hypothetical protein